MARPPTPGDAAAEVEAEKCPDRCTTAMWRGRFCDYHQGFADGYDLALERERVTGRKDGE